MLKMSARNKAELTHKQVIEHIKAVKASTRRLESIFDITITGDGEVITPYYDKYREGGSFERMCDTLADRIAFQIPDFDGPVSQEDGKALCAFFEFSPEESKKILSVCASDRQYQQYQEDERRMGAM
jgi:hypothetical protein